MKNIIKLFLITCVLFVAPQMSFSETVLKNFAGNACKKDDVLTPEPLHVRPILENAPLVTDVKTQAAAFNAEEMFKLFTAAKIKRDDVSTSHIVNLLSSNFKKIKALQDEAIQKKELLLLEENKTYPLEEYEKRKASTEAFNQKHVKPILWALYINYMDALKRQKETQAAVRDQKSYDAVLALAQNHRKVLQDLINKNIPTLTAKIGEIPPAIDQNLPISYRDGYIVKIRFKKTDDSLSITLYPRLILSQLQGEDQVFLQSLERWKDYTHSMYTAALQEKNLNESYAGWFYSIVWNVSGYTELPAEKSFLLERFEDIEKAYTKSNEDLQNAKQISKVLSRLTQSELFSLMDLFISLRFDDLPMCQNQIATLNDRMKTLMGNSKTTLSKDFKEEDKPKVDAFARDVVFYQDIYESFSTAAAIVLKNQ